MEKLDVELDIIKCKIHKEDLQDDFKERLEEKLNSACESKLDTTGEDVKNRISRPFYFHKAVAAVFVCIFMFSSYAFAGGVGDWIKEMFCNVDKEMEVAYENGDIKQVDTEYQTYDGVSVKVDYVSLKDNELYVVFNVKSEEEYEKVNITEIEILDNNNVVLNSSNIFKYSDFEYNSMKKSLNKNENLIFMTINNKENNFIKYNTLGININCIEMRSGNESKMYYGEWKFIMNIEE